MAKKYLRLHYGDNDFTTSLEQACLDFYEQYGVDELDDKDIPLVIKAIEALWNAKQKAFIVDRFIRSNYYWRFCEPDSVDMLKSIEDIKPECPILTIDKYEIVSCRSEQEFGWNNAEDVYLPLFEHGEVLLL